MPASGVPGLAYAVVADGEITSVGAHGVLRIGGDEEVTPDTPFLTGSISKSFTALAVMQLVEAGKVDLDAEVSHYLDGFSGRPAGRHHDPAAAQPHERLLHAARERARIRTSPAEKDELARRVDQLAEVTPAYEPGETVGVLEHELPDSWSPDRSRERAGVPGLCRDQHPGAGRHGAQLRRRRRDP